VAQRKTVARRFFPDGEYSAFGNERIFAMGVDPIVGRSWLED
jgi:hypothetical protein